VAVDLELLNDKKIKKMLINKIERPQTVIKITIAPITTELKAKVSTAIQSVVDRIKVKHLS
jgi:hypothetical protein